MTESDNRLAIPRLLAGEVVTFHYPGVMADQFNFISGFLFRLLHELDLGFFSELLFILLREVTNNCFKANAKRLLFDDHNRDIENQEDYDQLITSFQGQVLARWSDFVREHADGDYYVAVHFQITKDKLEIVVENNVGILPQEWERIQARQESYKQYKDLQEAIQDIGDESEGAGLGIVLTLILMRNAGLSQDSFHIESKNDVTRTKLAIPRVLRPVAVKHKFRDVVLDEVEHLPSFPENVVHLINLCDSETSSLDIIAAEIQRDPSLTAQILKLVNSAGYMNRFRNPSLIDAVKIIGLKEIRNLLMVSGARHVVNSNYRHRQLEEIWETANRVSHFARRLSAKKPVVQNQATVVGLLYDLGRIVLLTLNPALVEKVQNLIGSGRIRTGSVIEEVELGIGSPEVGALLAEKWNFPEPLTTAIRHQQKPLQPPEGYEELVRTVYMAVRIQEAAVGLINYFALEPEVLASFGIGNEEQFLAKVKSFNDDYQSFDSSPHSGTKSK